MPEYTIAIAMIAVMPIFISFETYTYGSASTMEEAKKIRKSILDKFPEAYIVTFEE